MKRRAAFTLIEVMVAVVILAFTATAAIRLVIMAQNTLSAVKEKETLLNAAEALEAGIIAKETDPSGASGDIKWETADKETEMMGENFGRLNFDKASGDSSEEQESLKWREITVSDKKDRKIILYIPSKEQEETENQAVSSEDSQSTSSGDASESKSTGKSTNSSKN